MTNEEPVQRMSVPFVIFIEKMRSSRGVNFANDLDLYTNEVNECRRQILTNVINNKLDPNQQIIITESGNFDWTALKKENNCNNNDLSN